MCKLVGYIGHPGWEPKEFPGEIGEFVGSTEQPTLPKTKTARENGGFQ